MKTANRSLLIIAGGKSSRMGMDKRWLELAGCSLLERLLQKAEREPFVQKYLCVEAVTDKLSALAKQYGCILLADEQKGAGPMEGLCRGLQAMTTEYALAISCDMPFFEFSEVSPLWKAVSADPSLRAAVVVANGRCQPLAAVYHRDLAAKFAAALEGGQRKLGIVVKKVPHGLIPVESAVYFFNANTPADMRLVRGRMANKKRKTPLITISAPVSNTGKTTFLEKLIPGLREQGLRVGVVKGDCHGYNVDVEGKDSWRFSKAGAESVAVVSPDGYFIQQHTKQRASLLAVAEKLEDVDLVFIESRNHGTLPKISLWRGLGDPIVDEDTTVLFSSEPKDQDLVCYEYSINDVKQAMHIVTFLIAR